MDDYNNKIVYTHGASRQSFLDALLILSEKAKKSPEITIETIFAILADKGFAALLIILSIPFCFPITIPGTSTLFGVIIAFLGLRIAFAKKPWWPRWVLEKKMKGEHIDKLAQGVIKFVLKLQKLSRPRWTFLTRNTLLHRLHGILIFFLAILLAMPIPVPLTNILCAFPILFIGLGLLEDDGIAIIIGYILALICFATFFALFMFGGAQLWHLYKRF